MPASPKAGQGKASNGKGASRSSGGKGSGGGRRSSAKSPAPASAPAATPPQSAPEEPKEPPKISVTLTLFGTGDQPVELPEKSTVADLLVQMGLSAKEGEVLVNARRVNLKYKLKAGEQVMFATKIEGGSR